MKKGFTLLEIIFVIVISAILSVGTFKAVEALFIKSAKAKAVTDMTLRSQIVLDQLGVLLYNRIQNSVIGYDVGGDCEALEDTTSPPVIEWLGTMDVKLLNKEYDGFIDMGGSDRGNKILLAPYMDANFDSNGVNLIFAGAFDRGRVEDKACSGAFGWHGNDSNSSYDINITDKNKIQLTDDADHQPKDIYEKYYLTKTAYAVTRGEELTQKDLVDNCPDYKEVSEADFNNTLFLFYGYAPFVGNGHTFCGDSQGTREGNVSILATDVTAFGVAYKNDVFKLNLDMNRTIKGSTYVHIYKQKVVL